MGAGTFAAAALLAVTSGFAPTAGPPTDSCSWRSAAQRLAESVAEAEGARASTLRSALEALGFSPGTLRHDGCDDAVTPDSGNGGGAASVVPADAEVLFEADYESGDLSQWDTCQNRDVNSSCADYSGGSPASVIDGDTGSTGDDGGGGGLLDDVVDTVTGGVGKVARFVVEPGDVPDFGGGERSEVAAHGEGAATREGDERWYEFALRFPEGFEAPAGGEWFIVMQWHSGSGSPPLALEVNSDGELYVGGEGGPQEVIGPVRPGEWVDYTLNVGFSSGDGWVEVWENGEPVVERHQRQTMASDENYLKMGIYRGNGDSSTAEVWIDGPRISAPGGSSGSSSGAGSSGLKSSDEDTSTDSDFDSDSSDS